MLMCPTIVTLQAALLQSRPSTRSHTWNEPSRRYLSPTGVKRGACWQIYKQNQTIYLDQTAEYIQIWIWCDVISSQSSNL